MNTSQDSVLTAPTISPMKKGFPSEKTQPSATSGCEMLQKYGPQKRPQGPANLPPRGMAFEERPTSSLPFRARWRGPDGVRHARSFPSAAMRDAFVAEWSRQRKDYGKAVRVVQAVDVQTWAEFREICGEVHPLQVAREWLHFRGVSSDLPIADAWMMFNSDQEQRKLSPDTHSHRRLHGKRLCAAFAGISAASVTTEALERWVAQTGESAKTRRHHLKTAKHFFEWLKDRRKISHNPADAVTPPDASEFDAEGKPVHADVNILTVDECRTLFAKNAGKAVVGRLALEAFGGLRYTSAARLVKADIAWTEKGITLPAYAHKSGKRHYVDGWPANLWRWLESAPAACWELSKRDYQGEKLMAFARADVKLTHNCLRHSFATYHLSAYKDARLTAYLMTKTSLQSLNNDYRGRATEEAGKAWFGIVP